MPFESFLTWWPYPAYTKSAPSEGTSMLWPDTNGKGWTTGNIVFLVIMSLIGLALAFLLYLSAPDL